MLRHDRELLTQGFCAWPLERHHHGISETTWAGVAELERMHEGTSGKLIGREKEETGFLRVPTTLPGIAFDIPVATAPVEASARERRPTRLADRTTGTGGTRRASHRARASASSMRPDMAAESPMSGRSTSSAESGGS